MEKLLITFAILFLGWIAYLGIGLAVSNPEVIIKETDKLIYVKKYTIYNRDSSVYVYKQAKLYNGVVIDKNKYLRFVGIIGKGGHYTTNYNTTIKYDGGKLYKSFCADIYNTYDKGDYITLKETWYPSHNIIILKK